MKTLSHHLILDAWLDEPVTNEIVEKILAFVEKNFHVVRKVRHTFSPFGETSVYVLAESHFTIHTYPEHNYLSMDLYACQCKLSHGEIIAGIFQGLKVKDHNVHSLTRGQPNALPLTVQAHCEQSYAH